MRASPSPSEVALAALFLAGFGLLLAAAGATAACARGAADARPAAAGGERDGDPASDRRAERSAMVDRQIAGRGVEDPRVLAALREVPRHRFVLTAESARAYDDRPLPIGHRQTISQPYIVALMCELLELGPEDRVLEIGTGSGYHAAVLSRLAAQVYSIEIVAPLGRRARSTLAELGYDNVRVRLGDGYGGWPEAAPFDAIVLTAAPAEVPRPLLEQLRVGGRMVIPVGDGLQELRRIVRTADGYETEDVLPVRFVPMTGTAAARPPG